jgi:hypothetical protein
MWKSILFHILISFVAIYLIHYLWNHFKNSWTTKKSKDLVNTHISKYKKIAEEAIQNYGKRDFENNETKILEKELGDYLTSIYGDCENCDSTPDVIALPNNDNIQIELMPNLETKNIVQL